MKATSAWMKNRPISTSTLWPQLCTIAEARSSSKSGGAYRAVRCAQGRRESLPRLLTLSSSTQSKGKDTTCATIPLFPARFQAKRSLRLRPRFQFEASWPEEPSRNSAMEPSSTTDSGFRMKSLQSLHPTEALAGISKPLSMAPTAARC